MRLSPLLVIGPAVGLCACATDAGARDEVASLKAELRALKERQAAVERRISRVESDQAVSDGLKAQVGDGAQVPSLTVVRLKPRQQPAPRLETRVRVKEPEQDDVERELSPRDRVPDVDPAILEAEFNRYVRSLNTGDVSGGAQKLEAFANEHPDNPHADNALYFSGLGLMGLDDYPGAAERFERVLKDYPAGDAVPDALLKLAECRMRLNQRQQAHELYLQVAQSYPGTAAATQAQARLGLFPP